MTYSVQDALESAVGSFGAVLFYFALNANKVTAFINPKSGLIIGAIWTLLLYHAFKAKMRHQTNTHFILDSIITLTICYALTISFGMATPSQLKGFAVFGSPVLISFLLGLPVALISDIWDIKSALSRYYITKEH